MKKWQKQQIYELLNQDDPFYGIYMVYDMYGPLSNEEHPKNQGGDENE
ncbi:MAG: hypothetical protein ACTSPV_19785 [Candidatus Hodarchaeales archaeon]